MRWQKALIVLAAMLVDRPGSLAQENHSAPAPAKVEQLRKVRAEGLLGQTVMNAGGDVFGHVADVLIDADGTPHAAVIDITGFFGIGDRSIAVAWSALRFKTQNDHIAIILPLDIPALKAMPQYRPEAPSVPVATPTVPLPKGAVTPATPPTSPQPAQAH